MSSWRERVRGLRRGIYPPWRDPNLSAAMFLVSMVYLFSGLGEWLWTDYRNRETPITLQAVVLTAMSGLELIRARAPRVALRSGLGITLVCVFWLGTTLPLLVILSDLLYAGVLYGPRRFSRRVVMVVAIMIPVSALAGYLFTSDWRFALLIILTLLLVPATTVTWAMQVRIHREIVQEERARSAQLERLVELERRAAVQAERSRMARDLHDVVAGQLSAIAIQSEALLVAGRREPDEEQAVLRSVRENSVQALAEMRAMIGLLRGDEAETASTPRLADLDALIDSARAAGVPLRVRRAEVPAATRAVELAGYRIAQEALTNVVKHGSGEQATLDLAVHDGELVLRVENRLAAPVEETVRAGTGLDTMAERAAAVDGALEAGPSGPDRRYWRVVARLPLGVAAEPDEPDEPNGASGAGERPAAHRAEER